jgi:hypothetical protein
MNTSPPRLIKLIAFRQRYFEPGQAPGLRTLRDAIATGELPGAKVGGVYYVDLNRWLPEITGDAEIKNIKGI